MKDRHRQHLGDVGGVGGRAGLGRGGGEADLVVDDDMDGAAGLVAVESREVEGFRYNPLAGKGGLAVDQHRQDLLPAAGAGETLPGPAFADHHRVNSFEVAGVGGEGEVDLLSGGVFAVGGKALVVFHIPFADEGELQGLGELGKDGRQGLGEDVGKDVDAAAVGHPQHQVDDPELLGQVDQVVEEGDEEFTPLQGKALLTEKLAMEKLFEEGGFLKFFQNRQLLRAG